MSAFSFNQKRSFANFSNFAVNTRVGYHLITFF